MWWILCALAAPTTYLVPHGPASDSAVVGIDGGVLVIGEGGSWWCSSRGCVPRAALPFPRKDFAVVVDAQERVWALGGWSQGPDGSEPSASVHRYDADGDRWVPMAPMPRAVARPRAGFASDGRLMVQEDGGGLIMRDGHGVWAIVGSPVTRFVSEACASGGEGQPASMAWALPATADCVGSSPARMLEDERIATPTGWLIVADGQFLCVDSSGRRPATGVPAGADYRVHRGADLIAWSRPTGDGRVQVVVDSPAAACGG